MSEFWRNLCSAKRLYGVLGFMVGVIAAIFVALFMVATRALIVGEVGWTTTLSLGLAALVGSCTALILLFRFIQGGHPDLGFVKDEHRRDFEKKDMQAQSDQLRFITDALPMYVFQVDSEERFLFANAAFCQLLNVKTEGLVGKSLENVFGTTVYLRNRDDIKRALAGNIVSYERLSDIAPIPMTFSITMVPEFDALHQVVGFVLVSADITKYKDIEVELNQAKKAAEGANAAKSTFLANMSHEIRTPIGAILGFAELMNLEETSPAERAGFFEVIKRNGALLINIIDDILDLSKVEAGKIALSILELSLVELMDDVFAALNLRAVEKGLKLNFIFDKNQPQNITTDPFRLRQILLNIIGNAIKFTFKGQIDVKIALAANRKGQTSLIFTVSDTGAGISPEQAMKLFTAFTQADASTTRNFGGTGLGLVLSKKLANSLDGDVFLEKSVLGLGSTFVVEIGVGDRVGEKLLPLAINASSIPRLDGLSILLVDDSPDNQLLLSRILVKGGAAVTTASNGKEAVDLALDGAFHLVLMDLQMPVMDGYEALNELKRQHYNKPVVALTAHTMQEEYQRCISLGFDGHIAKPVTRDSLIRAVAHFAKLT